MTCIGNSGDLPAKEIDEASLVSKIQFISPQKANALKAESVLADGPPKPQRVFPNSISDDSSSNLNNEDHILWVIEHTFYSIRPLLSTQMAINVRLILLLQAVNGNVQ